MQSEYRAQVPLSQRSSAFSGQRSSLGRNGSASQLFLSSTTSDPMQLKINGEQNRVLLDQVRPSCFTTKVLKGRGSPTKSGGDSHSASKTLNEADSLNDENSISRFSGASMGKFEQPGISAEEQHFSEELRCCAGEERFAALREAFERYAAFGETKNQKRLESG